MSAQGVGYAAAVVLAVAFALAAIAKLRDLDATIDGFTALGLPSPRVFAAVIPLAELGIVALLLIVPAAGGIAALVTLAFFTTFLVGRLRAGVRAPCACFGAARALPLSRLDVARNIALAMLAVASLPAERPGGVMPTDALVVLACTAVVGGALAIARRTMRSGPTREHR